MKASNSKDKSGRPETRNAPFFIVGCVRSGTTMLRDVLRRHPNLTAPEETHLFRWTEPFGTEAYMRGVRSNAVLKRHREMDGIMKDPEVVGRISRGTPKMIQDLMAQMPAIQKRIEAATADLPKARSYADLTQDQRARLAKLIGVDEQDLAKGSAKPGVSRRSTRH